MQRRGLVDVAEGAPVLTPAGEDLRDHIEARTDTLAASAWAAIDADDAERLRTIVRPWSKAIVASGFGRPTG